MPTKTFLSLATFCVLALAPNIQADERLDQILNELKSLREQVANLEARLEAVESQPASNTVAQQQATGPIQPREKKTWFDNMRVELKKAEVRASGAWTTPSTWDGIETGQKVDEVIAILGEPTQRKFSVRRDTDEILYYQGDLEGTGELIQGEIRIYKGKVRRFTSPDFPAEG
ncbi:hypothetical protein [Pelagicoccus mobilis]|uniref:Type IV pilus biogenesis protein PilP n=1 Tax=Pelagicoccus mobilis TaxID=415221 RepID=A0A934S2U1_9BACT|nr:hypothetical protein [Pelagicoccus mobilis]MBK1878802.1 hypothetical protein [Pelagicoccus mobilis]